jgi:hypothetical protein
VAPLHSFRYDEAERQFEQIAKDDPKCAMAQWGLAMSQWHQLWNHPDETTTKKGLAEIKRAAALRAPSARERGYVAALKAFYRGKGDFQARAAAYSEAMKTLHEQNPDDHEAAAFYGSPCSRPMKEKIRTSRRPDGRQPCWRSCSQSSPIIRAWLTS